MKKFMIMFALLMGCLSTFAQKTAIETPKLLDNVYVGAQIGATTPMNFNQVFPLNSQLSVRLGKNWSPILGIYLEGTAFAGSREMYYSDTFVKNTTVSLGSTINLCNLFGGYKLRKWDVNTVASVGWFHVLNSENNEGNHSDDLVAKTGLDVNYNISDAWTIYLEPAVYWNLTQNEGATVQFNEKYAQVGLALGFNYKFKCSNGTHNFKLWNIDELNDQINQLRMENEALRNVKPTTVTKTIEKTVPEFIDRIVVVPFAQNSDELSAEARTLIYNVNAKKVSVVGYASPEGTVEYNQKLSESRANVVKKALEAQGITVTNCEGRGAVDNQSNRIVKIIAQ